MNPREASYGCGEGQCQNSSDTRTGTRIEPAAPVQGSRCTSPS